MTRIKQFFKSLIEKKKEPPLLCDCGHPAYLHGNDPTIHHEYELRCAYCDCKQLMVRTRVIVMKDGHLRVKA